MKASYISVYNSYIEYPNDGVLSLEICTTEDIGFEYCIFVVKENSYCVSLNPNDPIEDVEIPEEDWNIIQSYINNKFGGYKGILEKTQEFYNKYMSPEEREEYHKNNIIKELEII